MKTIIITGASSGIGHAICKKMLHAGYHVIGIARDFSKSPLQSEKFHRVQIDLADLKTLPENLQLLLKDHNNIDAVVCCAGKGQFASLEEFSYAQIQALVDLNFLSQVFITKAVIPVLKREGHGDIIFIGSESALTGSRKGAVYCASKFALRGFAQALRDECSKSNVRVSVINPGMVKSAFFDELDFLPGDDDSNFIEPDDVAAVVSMIMSARAGTVFDEINLSPLKKVIKFKKPPNPLHEGYVS